MFAKLEFHSFNSKIYNTVLLIASVLACILLQEKAVAGDVRLKAGVSAEFIKQDIDRKDNSNKIKATNIIVRPFGSLAYQNRDLDVQINATHNQVRRNLSDQTVTENYSEYDYNGKYKIVNDLLTMQISGLRSYQNQGLNSYLVDDFLLNSQALNKIESDKASVDLNIRRGAFFGLSTSVRYNKTVIEQSANNAINLDDLSNNGTYGFDMSLVSGKNLDGATINLISSGSYSKRKSSPDYINQIINLSSDIEVYKQLSFVLNTSYENNEIKTDINSPAAGSREFYTYGAGISWDSGRDRTAKILWNKSFKKSQLEGAEKETDSYLSYNINWAFSERTQLQASISKRFYGDSGNLLLSHELKNWRTSVNYTEVVSSNSELLTTQGLGLFVCDIGSTSIADCSLSDTLDPTLEVGQSLIPITIQNYGFDDRIILRKAFSAQTAVTRRRTTLFLFATQAKIEELEVDSLSDTTTIGLKLSFDISQRTSLDVGQHFSKIKSDRDNIIEEAISREFTIDLNRKMSRNFTMAVGFRYLDRDGDVITGTQSVGGFNGPVTDRRITFKVSYTFGSEN